MPFRLFMFTIIVSIIGTPMAVAQSRKTITGPVKASVISVYDGDTIEVLANVWPGTQINVRVRIRGIDAPEMRSKCAAERRAAVSARERLRQFIANKPVLLTNIKGGKYFGRVLASVQTGSGANMKEALLASGLVRPYRGKKRAGWC